MKRRRFQTSLKTLLAIVFCSAVATWIYAIGWPTWMAYREGKKFEEMARNLKAGASQNLFSVLPANGANGSLMVTHIHDSEGRPVQIIPFKLPLSWYCVYIEVKEENAPATSRLSRGRRGRETWQQVRVYRIDPAPSGYRAQTEAAGRKRLRNNEGRLSTLEEPDSTEQYLSDFAEVATGRAHSEVEFGYEVIHTDSL